MVTLKYFIFFTFLSDIKFPRPIELLSIHYSCLSIAPLNRAQNFLLYCLKTNFDVFFKISVWQPSNFDVEMSSPRKSKSTCNVRGHCSASFQDTSTVRSSFDSSILGLRNIFRFFSWHAGLPFSLPEWQRSASPPGLFVCLFVRDLQAKRLGAARRNLAG